VSPIYDTEENHLKVIEAEIDATGKKLTPILYKCDGIHRVAVSLTCYSLYFCTKY